jgi:hypothetical protein
MIGYLELEEEYIWEICGKNNLENKITDSQEYKVKNIQKFGISSFHKSFASRVNSLE